MHIQNKRVSDPYLRPAFSLRHRFLRLIWQICWQLLCRPTPVFFHRWRRILLRAFGAKIGPDCHIYPEAIIWAPWNLECGQAVAIANGAEIYNPRCVVLGDYATISQKAYLCGATHDYTSTEFPLISSPINIGSHAWIAARAIVLKGVTIGDGCVVGAGSVVTRSMPPWTVCAGNPCQVIKNNYERH
jgi:putative colanic acid biosynthesis acetyltransferase WcaF